GRPPCRDHHGRQRALGRAARAARPRGPPPGRPGAQADRPRRGRARPARAHGLRVLDRELEPSSGRGRGADGDVRRPDRVRDPRAPRRGRAHALRGAARGDLRRADRAHGRSRVPYRRQRADDPVRGLQLRRTGRDPRRRRALHRRRRARLPPLPLRPGDGRPGAADPHQRRAAALELPAVAERVLGARVLGRPVAGLRPRRAGGRARGVRRPPAALGGAL
ncbi:MAG: Undecaprenyl diphosphate synthase, partial [uncultured Solirubrobacterales bacterium]